MRVHLFFSFVLFLRLSLYFSLLGGCEFTTITHNTNHSIIINRSEFFLCSRFPLSIFTHKIHNRFSSFPIWARVSVWESVLFVCKALTTNIQQNQCALLCYDIHDFWPVLKKMIMDLISFQHEIIINVFERCLYTLWLIFVCSPWAVCMVVAVFLMFNCHIKRKIELFFPEQERKKKQNVFKITTKGGSNGWWTVLDKNNQQTVFLVSFFQM